MRNDAKILLPLVHYSYEEKKRINNKATSSRNFTICDNLKSSPSLWAKARSYSALNKGSAKVGCLRGWLRRDGLRHDGGLLERSKFIKDKTRIVQTRGEPIIEPSSNELKLNELKLFWFSNQTRPSFHFKAHIKGSVGNYFWFTRLDNTSAKLGLLFHKTTFSAPDIQARARACFSSSLRWSSKRSRCTPVSIEQRVIVATKMKKTTRTTDAIFFKIKIGRSEDFLAKYLIKVFVQFGRSYGN